MARDDEEEVTQPVEAGGEEEGDLEPSAPGVKRRRRRRRQESQSEGLDTVKKQEKNHEISEDDQERLAADVQKATDAAISEIDHLLGAKEKEILTV